MWDPIVGADGRCRLCGDTGILDVHVFAPDHAQYEGDSIVQPASCHACAMGRIWIEVGFA